MKSAQCSEENNAGIIAGQRIARERFKCREKPEGEAETEKYEADHHYTDYSHGGP